MSLIKFLKTTFAAWLLLFITLQHVSSMLEVDLTHSEAMVKGDRDYINLDNLRIKKVNKTHHMLVGDIIIHKELGDDYEVMCSSYKKAGNDYKLLPYKLGQKKFCEFLESEKLLYPEVQAVSNLPPIETCPWPIGEYKINGYNPELSKLPPVIDTGDYMVECKIFLNDQVVQGIKVFGSVLNLSPMG